MKTIKINNKKYEIPNLTFRHFTLIEEQGFSLIDAFRKQEIFLLVMGFVCVVTGSDRDDAERLIEQHILGGGDLQELYVAFGEAVNDSAFFKKMLGLEEQTSEKKTKTKVMKMEEAKSEEE